eukprot:scaffold288695_cov32-Tisochrysis_lutea.AAC.2
MTKSAGKLRGERRREAGCWMDGWRIAYGVAGRKCRSQDVPSVVPCAWRQRDRARDSGRAAGLSMYRPSWACP